MVFSSQAPEDSLLKESPDFSLVHGGPLFQLLRRAHLSDDTPPLLRRRIILISLLAWLPLLLLCALDSSLSGGVAVPFLQDVEVHSKFLLGIPLFIGAEVIVHQRMRYLVKLFLERRLIPEGSLPQFNDAIAAGYRLRESVLAEVLLIALVYFVGILVVWRHYTTLQTVTWYATPSITGSTLTRAGIWYGYVSLPIFQFLLLRWYFRLLIWARFLWKVSRIRLNLVPTHPDGNGGLGFLAQTVYAFAPLAVAHGALLAGVLAGRILHLGAKLPEFALPIVVMLAFLLCMFIGPLLLFVPQLAHAKRAGLRDYGTFAQRYVQEFDAKWLRRDPAASGEVMGSEDIRSLADLSESMKVIQGMSIVPVTKQAIIQLAAATLVPVLPLALTMMPFADLAKQLIKILF